MTADIKARRSAAAKKGWEVRRAEKRRAQVLAVIADVRASNDREDQRFRDMAWPWPLSWFRRIASRKA